MNEYVLYNDSVKEYVKAETDGPKHQKDELVDIWICRKEILRWRYVQL